MAGGLPGEGSTLLVPSGPKKHLFVVLTKPVGIQEDILIVGVSSIRDDQYHDPACKVYAGDHPFISRPSYVRYAFARTVSGSRLREALGDGYFKQLEPCSADLFDRICHGVVTSKHTAPRINTFYCNRPD